MFGGVWHEGVVEYFVTPENWFNIAYGDGEDVHPWCALEMHECLLQRHEGQSLPTHRFCSENEEKSDARFYPLFFWLGELPMRAILLVFLGCFSRYESGGGE